MKEYDIQLAIEIEQTAIASNKVLDSRARGEGFSIFIAWYRLSDTKLITNYVFLLSYQPYPLMLFPLLS